jgi:hypothetical protein
VRGDAQGKARVMDRFIADAEVVLMMLVFAALIYFGAYKYINPKREAWTAKQTMVSLAWGAIGVVLWCLLHYVLHLAPNVITGIGVAAWVALCVAQWVRERRKPNISPTK